MQTVAVIKTVLTLIMTMHYLISTEMDMGCVGLGWVGFGSEKFTHVHLWFINMVQLIISLYDLELVIPTQHKQPEEHV